MGSFRTAAAVGFCTYTKTQSSVCCHGGNSLFLLPWEDTGPDTRDTKEEQGGLKEVDKAEVKETAEVQETKVTVPKITEEAMEEADYEVVETTDPSTTSSAFPPTPQNSFASLPSL